MMSNFCHLFLVVIHRTATQSLSNVSKKKQLQSLKTDPPGAGLKANLIHDITCETKLSIVGFVAQWVSKYFHSSFSPYF